MQTSKVEQLRKQLAKAIEQEHKKANAAFRRMSPAKRRVTLAQDVLSQIAIQRLIPEHGLYVRRTDGRDLFKASRPLREVVDTKCEVCAKGALLVAAADRMNGVKLKSVVRRDDIDSDNDVDLDSVASDEIKQYLRGVFDEKQLDLIEGVFEDYDLRQWLDEKTVAAVDPQYGSRQGIHYRVSRSDSKNEDAKVRLTAIMRNIIANNGEFKPEVSKLELRW